MTGPCGAGAVAGGVTGLVISVTLTTTATTVWPFVILGALAIGAGISLAYVAYNGASSTPQGAWNAFLFVYDKLWHFPEPPPGPPPWWDVNK